MSWKSGYHEWSRIKQSIFNIRGEWWWDLLSCYKLNSQNQLENCQMLETNEIQALVTELLVAALGI